MGFFNTKKRVSQNAELCFNVEGHPLYCLIAAEFIRRGFFCMRGSQIIICCFCFVLILQDPMRYLLFLLRLFTAANRPARAAANRTPQIQRLLLSPVFGVLGAVVGVGVAVGAVTVKPAVAGSASLNTAVIECFPGDSVSR